MTTASQRLFERAIDAHRKSALEDAKTLYHEVLRADPNHAAAYGNLAIIAAGQGDFIRAEALFRHQVRLRPDSAAAYNHLGSVLQQQGRWDDAIVAHQRAIALNPNHIQAHLALGNALKAQHRLDEAMRCYLAALAIKPDYAEAHNNVGVVLQLQDKLIEAAGAYRKAAAAMPGYAEAYFNLGAVLHQMRDLKVAETAYRPAIALYPNVAVAHNNLGTVLKDLGRLDAAMAAFERAIDLQGDYAEAIYNRATILQEQRRLEDAIAGYGRALLLRGDYIDAINNAGIVLQELGRLRDAIDLYRRVAQPMPVHADLYNNLGTALLADGRPEEASAALEQALACRRDFPQAAYNLGNALRERGDLGAAMKAWQDALALRPGYFDALCQLAHHRALACAWDSHEQDHKTLRDLVASGVRVPPFYLFATPATPAEQLRCAEQWIAPLKPQQADLFRHGARSERPRIRLGYLSADFRQHATARLMAELFENHDRNRFEVSAYSYGVDDASPLRGRLARAFDRFVDIAALPHRDAAAKIHADEIDILIDLKGYTHGARPAIAAYRPAPVQVSYLGFPATTGADFIDYILVDRFVVPQSQQACFAERLVHLPNCYQVNDRKRDAQASPTERRDCGLPEHGLVLCCFNNSYKLTPQVFDIWMRLLRRTPGSVLWLVAGNALVEANLRYEAAQRDVDPARLVFAPLVAPAAHLERHRHADLFLDTAPCNAHTTASDALWCGLPVLTKSGDTFAGRVAGSLLSAIGLQELVTSSLEHYERTAIELIRAPERLTALRRKIARERDLNSLFDLPQSTAAIEAAYQRMWQRWRAGEEPLGFSVDNV